MSTATRFYVTGIDRCPRGGGERRAHLYCGTGYNDLEGPMCKAGWNRDGGQAFSIFRGHSGSGICKVCLRRKEAGLGPVPAATDEEAERNIEARRNLGP